jgi:predicted transposase/invertase (TIGR01784 family)
VGVENGIQIGIKKGKQEEKLAIARWLKSQNMSFDQIAESTGLSLDEIAKL